MKKFGKIILVLMAAFMITGCGCEKEETPETVDAEKIFKDYVADYYNTTWKNDVVQTQVRSITIERLGQLVDENDNQRYDVSKIKVGQSLCSAESYAEVTIPDLSKLDNFTIKVYLTCGDYKSADQIAKEKEGE